MGLVFGKLIFPIISSFIMSWIYFLTAFFNNCLTGYYLNSSLYSVSSRIPCGSYCDCSLTSSFVPHSDVYKRQVLNCSLPHCIVHLFFFAFVPTFPLFPVGFTQFYFYFPLRHSLLYLIFPHGLVSMFHWSFLFLHWYPLFSCLLYTSRCV